MGRGTNSKEAKKEAMSWEEIEEMLEEVGLPMAYHHFEPEGAVDPPFLVWLIQGSNNWGADGSIYCKISQLNIELYTDEKSPELEEKLERILDTRGIFYNKTEGYLEEEQMYEILYEMEVTV